VPYYENRLNTKASPWSARQLARRALLGCAPRRKVIESLPGTGSLYLTFDDGPDPTYSPRILDILREHRALATFFVLGQNCAKHPELVRRIAEEGHEVGNHSFSHVDARLVSRREYLRDFQQADEIIERTVGKAIPLFRPPYGRLTFGSCCSLLLRKRMITLWNVDVKDYCTDESAAQQWLEQNPMQDGDIVLLHDVHPHAAAILPRIIQEAAARGLACRSLVGI
jgi:peptidoglycan/xylan/chitin deacetylase (PgdA/CDA1 family)